MQHPLTMTKTALAVALLTIGAAASAAPCDGVSVGTSATGDVTLGGLASDACFVSEANPQSGPSGDTSGFSGAFGGGWSLLDKIESGSGSELLNGVTFSWTFSQQAGKAGTWSLATDVTATYDLVFAMHASNRSGAFLFDDQTTFASTVAPGTWTINWLNEGGQVPDFSNLTLFVRDVAVAPIPEPETYALMLAGLGALGAVARRRKSR
jgi:hypothetical protein